MAFALGIDVGTSFTAAAITRPGSDEAQASEPLALGTRGGAVPSVIFLGDDGQVLVGESAERRGRDHPERLVREFKRRVGDAVPVVVGDLTVAPEDIFATMARWVVDRAEEREGAPPDAITVTHPASWGQHKISLVREALAGVGLADVTLMTEPEAAALHYASQARVDAGATIAVYDLGAGTFDVALLTKTGDRSFEPIGRPEGIERLGGSDFDDAVFGHVVAHASDAFRDLDTTDPGILVALSRLRRECTEAKEALSFDSEASIPVLLPGNQGSVRIVRSEFEGLIDAPVRQTISSLQHALATAGVEPDDLAAILLIGGSSRVPLVAQLLSEEVKRPLAIDADPKASIALGAALAAAAALPGAVRVGAGGGSEEGPDTEQSLEPADAQIARSSGLTAVSMSSVRARAFQAARLVGMAAAVGVIIAVAGSTPASPNLTSNGASATDEAAGQYQEGTEEATPVVPSSTTEPAPNPIVPQPIERNDRGPLKPPEEPAQPEAGTQAPAPGDAETAPVKEVVPPAGTTTNPAPSPAPAPNPAPTPVPTPDPVPEPTPDPVPEPTPEPTPDPAPDPTPEPTPDPTPDPTPEPGPEPSPAPEPAPEPAP
ncbi:Hsp70 family protein [Mycetocola miduiensis]|uniref:Hsp70 protein n=1 Tax=Mycetocola miduiensis TaxID=995034 RepID=A0A1I5BM32_9MICO|nr:Hsp70 family protein [Mycetocola miduiensis]SFN75700.1 Hsp70 protein [Mycetocola miduiensis]